IAAVFVRLAVRRAGERHDKRRRVRDQGGHLGRPLGGVAGRRRVVAEHAERKTRDIVDGELIGIEHGGIAVGQRADSLRRWPRAGSRWNANRWLENAIAARRAAQPSCRGTCGRKAPATSKAHSRRAMSITVATTGLTRLFL